MVRVLKGSVMFSTTLEFHLGVVCEINCLAKVIQEGATLDILRKVPSTALSRGDIFSVGVIFSGGGRGRGK